MDVHANADADADVDGIDGSVTHAPIARALIPMDVHNADAEAYADAAPASTPAPAPAPGLIWPLCPYQHPRVASWLWSDYRRHPLQVPAAAHSILHTGLGRASLLMLCLWPHAVKAPGLVAAALPTVT
eukprot:4814149-Pleurochrysis_carterae.AAC.1